MWRTFKRWSAQRFGLARGVILWAVAYGVAILALTALPELTKSIAAEHPSIGVGIKLLIQVLLFGALVPWLIGLKFMVTDLMHKQHEKDAIDYSA